MKRISVCAFCILVVAAAFLVFLGKSSAQSSSAQRRITQAIDESRLTQLRGNTHPWARPEFDQGASPPDLPMERMLLVLKSSPEREAALNKFMEELQDRTSPNFHKWLTPVEFGRQFGASEEDIQTVTSWLESHGFRINEVTKGRTLIDFSGTASNVKEALHAEIHKYFVNGEEHWANASDPRIPAALTPVVAGVNTLHNFRRTPTSHRRGAFERSKTSGKVRPRHPEFTFPTSNGCGIVLTTTDCFVLSPGDFATIYNLFPLWTAGIDGTGQTIAVVGDSNINVQDAQDFRSLFGLPANNPNVILAGADPGMNGDEGEADLDTQWSGAVAKGATIDLVIASDTNAAFGVDLAAEFIINTMSPTPQVLSESFGQCELFIGTSGNQMFGGGGNVPGLWPQASSEGISVMISSGDNGSAGCANPSNLGVNTPPQPTSTGLAVSGLASTPFNTAVGGTDFDQFSNPFLYWSAVNSTVNSLNQVSAMGYIPETSWNESCTNTIWGLVGFSTSTQTNCNNITLRPSFVVPIGGSGGMSNCTTSNGTTVSSCSGGYAKPSWQTALTPVDGKRDLPDVSLFAGSGLVSSFYVVCERDDPGQGGPCTTSAFVGFGGTSVSVQSFAGIVALIDQQKGASQGLINTRLYQLAGQAGATCASAANPAANCIFYDVAKGTIAQPCVKGSTNCSETTTAVAVPSIRNFSRATVAFVALGCVFFVGFLVLGHRYKERAWGAAFALFIFALFMTCAACGGGSGSNNGGGGGGGGPVNGILTGYDAVTGYDRATGLGTVNINNLVINW